MITRIELHNFMSHRETVIEPSPGLTVLVGPNNCGKSALVAALQILCHNENSTYVKRHGAKECAVVVHTSEGNVIEWRRKTSPRYLINGVEYGRLGNSGVPAELHALLRLPLVAEEADDSFNVHFGSQKSPIFLLNSKAGTAAKFFASSSDASRLIAMQQRHRDKVTEARREHKRLEQEASINSAELAALEAIVPLADRIADLESLHDRLDRLQNELAGLERSTADLVERREQVDRQSACHAALRPLAAPPVLADPAPLDRHIAQLTTVRRQAERLDDDAQLLEQLPSPPTLDDVASIEQTLQAITTTSRQIGVLDRSGETLHLLHPPPPLEDAIALEALVRQLDRAGQDERVTQARSERLRQLSPAPALAPEDALEAALRALSRQTAEVQRMQRAAAATSGLVPAPLQLDVSALASHISTLSACIERTTDLRQSLLEIESEIATVRADLRTAVEGQTCPTCGQAFDADQLLAMAAAGLGGHAHG